MKFFLSPLRVFTKDATRRSGNERAKVRALLDHNAVPIHNSTVAEQFQLLSDLLEIQGANPFRVRAYRNAAFVVENYPTSLAELVSKGEELPKLPGLGKDLTEKVAEICRTGELTLLKEVQKKMPPSIAQLLRIPGLGPKRVMALRSRLKIQSLEQLRKAAEAGKIRKLDGFGEKTEQRILESFSRESPPRQTRPGTRERRVSEYAEPPRRFRLSRARQIARPLIAYLKAHEGVDQVEIAGSYRRLAETVGDIDILATVTSTRAAASLMQHFAAYEDVLRVLASGTTRATVLLAAGIQVDLRVLQRESFGAALHYFTGSKSHNIAVRGLGVRKGIKINEYGVFRGRKRIAGATEEEIFAAVELPFIPPELRENQGEIEAGFRGKLPRLVALSQIRGDLHAHTIETDGRATLENMARRARELGREYLGITDHSRHLAMTHGLTPQRLLAQIRKIDRFNEKNPGIRLLKGIECDILEDGTLDLPDSALKHLDYTVCSIHSKFNLSQEKQTERILRAMENPYFTILGHATGRLIEKRNPYPIHIERIVRAARDRGCFLELNAQPERLDLIPTHCRLAKETGVKLVISTDAHSENELGFMEFGVAQARRGWLEASDVVNTLPLPSFLEALREVRSAASSGKAA